MEGEIIWQIGQNLQYQKYLKTHRKNIMLSAARCINFKFDSSGSNKWTGTILGATSGGTKLTITPEITDIDVDGVLVKAKGLRQKTGETAQIETNMVEITKEYLQSTVIGKVGTSADNRFDVIESKALIDDSDYIESLAYVGFKIDGSPIIIIFDYAICTSGLSLEGKNKEAAVVPATFECVANLTVGGNTSKLPYHIYVAKASEE